ncbi:MAG: class II fructose-bisphosphatase [Ardenticatenaceae bacterium]|nr:class II fructose-bisphosphatase [Ardenticatenaceae bacterium]
MMDIPWRNFGLDLVRVTETTALAAGRWVGSGNYEAAHRSATMAMKAALDTLDIDGYIVLGEDSPLGDDSPLCSRQHVGTGDGPEVDVIVDPIDGTRLLIRGHPGAVSVVGVAPRGTMWSPVSAVYMDKIVVDREAAEALVPECMDAPAAWTLALIARVKKKAVQDITVTVLDRPRHADLIQEIRATGARILLRQDGDAEGALVAAIPGTGVDVLMGIGGASQGVIAACAVKALGGKMLARLSPQSEAEKHDIQAAGLDQKLIMTSDEIIRSDRIFFSVTGITDSKLLNGINFHGMFAETHSLLLRAETGTRRFIYAEHAARV